MLLQVMTQLAEVIAETQPATRSAPPRYITSNSILAAAQGQGGSYKGLAALFGDPKDQLAFIILSLLPWLCLNFRHTPYTPLAQACIKVCQQQHPPYLWLCGCLSCL